MSKHILLVDDGALLRRSLAFNLEQAGNIVNTAASAEDALAMARRDPIGPPHDQLASIEDFKAFVNKTTGCQLFTKHYRKPLNHTSRLVLTLSASVMKG